MEIGNFNTFASFVDDATLSLENKIHRDLYNYLLKHVGSGAYSRGSGAGLNHVENESNSVLADALIAIKIVEAAAKYNLQTIPELRVIVGAEMVAVNREGNKIDVLVVFLPAIKPDVHSLSQLTMNIPSYGG